MVGNCQRKNTATELCRKLRKSTVKSACVTTIPPSHCPRHSHAQIGLISHLCTYGSRPQSYVDQMVLIDYNGQRRIMYFCANLYQKQFYFSYIFMCVCVCVCVCVYMCVRLCLCCTHEYFYLSISVCFPCICTCVNLNATLSYYIAQIFLCMVFP